jgi:translocation and assembly module TamB
LLDGRLHIESLQVERLYYSGANDPAAPPPALPASLALPVPLQIEHLHIARATIARAAMPAMSLEAIDGKFRYVGGNYQAELSSRIEVALPDASASGQLNAHIQLADRAPYALSGNISADGKATLLGGQAPASASASKGISARFDLQGALAKLGLTTSIKVDQASLNGQIWLQPFATYPLTSVALDVEGLDLGALRATLPHTRIDGKLALQDSSGTPHGHVSLRESLTKPAATLESDFSLRDGVLQIASADFSRATAQVHFSGDYGLAGSQAFSAQAQFRQFRLQDLGQFANAPALTLNGQFKTAGARLPALSADLEFTLKDSLLAGLRMQGDGRLKLRADHLEIPHLQLTAGANQLQAEGELAESGGALSFALTAPRLDQFGFGLGGALDVHGEAHGSFSSPKVALSWNAAKLRGPHELALEQSKGTADLTLAFKTPLPLRELKAAATLQGGRYGAMRLANLQAKGEFGAAASARLALDMRADGLITPQLRADKLVINADGSNAAHQISATLAEAGRDQRWAIELAGAWLHSATDWRWNGAVKSFSATGALAATLDAAAPLAFTRNTVSLNQFRLHTSLGLMQVEQFARTADGLHTHGQLQGFNLAALLQLNHVNPSIQTDLLLDGAWQLDQNVQAHEGLRGAARLQRRSGDVTIQSGVPVTLGLQTLEAALALDNGKPTLHLVADGRQLGHIAFDASAQGDSQATLSTDTPFSGRATLAIPSLTWLGPLLSPAILTEGRLNGDLSLAGSIAHPLLRGTLSGRDLRVFAGGSGVDLSSGELDASVDGETLQLQRLMFRSATGQVSAQGTIHPGTDQPAAHIDVKAEHFQVLNRSDRKLTLSGQTAIDWRAGRAIVNGTLTADEGSFDIGREGTPALSDDVVIVGAEKKSGRALPLAVDLELGLGKGVTIEGRGLQASVTGQLHMAGEVGGALRAQGTVQVSQGSYTAYGRKLAIEKGVLRFNGPPDNPALDIVAMQRQQEVAAGVALRGTVQSPRVILVSEPNVSEADKLAWLVLGHSLDSAAGGDLNILQDAAGALLSGGAVGGVQSRIASAFGLDEFKIANSSNAGLLGSFAGSSAASSQENLQQRIVTIGKRVSDRLYVSFRQSIQATGSVLLLTYTLSPRLTVEVETGTSSAISLLFNLAFD